MTTPWNPALPAQYGFVSYRFCSKGNFFQTKTFNFKGILTTSEIIHTKKQFNLQELNWWL